MQASPGTYALLLYSARRQAIQIGRWKRVSFDKGYYLYIGSAFGPGGIRSRAGRHIRKAKSLRWHIDYLRERCEVQAVFLHYGEERLEHDWAQCLLRADEYMPVDGFGCSDCSCSSHLFFTGMKPDHEKLASLLQVDLICVTPARWPDGEVSR